jgi:hypothetical protein
MKTRLFITFSFLACAPLGATIVLNGNDFTNGTLTYTQNFNTLPTTGSATWSDDSTIPGWYAQRTGTGTSIVASSGPSTQGNLYSYGTGTQTDRALGSIGSTPEPTAGHFAWGVQFENQSSRDITLTTLVYTGEQWWNNTNTPHTITLWYQVRSTLMPSLNPGTDNTGWTSLSSGNFTSIHTGSIFGTSYDGNAAPNRTLINLSSANLVVPDGHFLMVRWSDLDQGGSDHGLAIDDVALTFIPEPSSSLLMLSCFPALLLRRRR